MPAKLIFTADDFGASRFINDGIYDALLNGKLTAVSTFVTHQRSEPSIEDILTLTADRGLKIGIGLHFSITSGYSLLDRKSSLTDLSGNGFHYFRDAKGYRFSQIDLDELAEELVKQLNKLDDLLGDIPIDHVSNHHGITYIDRNFYRKYADTIRSYNYRGKYDQPIPIRSPVSWLQSQNPGVLDALGAPTTRQGIKLEMTKKLMEVGLNKLKDRESYARNIGLRLPDFLVDTIYGQPDTANLEGLAEQFRGKQFSGEFMFHLGKGNPDPHEVPHGINQIYFRTRQEELTALLGWDIEASSDINSFESVCFQSL